MGERDLNLSSSTVCQHIALGDNVSLPSMKREDNVWFEGCLLGLSFLSVLFSGDCSDGNFVVGSDIVRFRFLNPGGAINFWDLKRGIGLSS